MKDVKKSDWNIDNEERTHLNSTIRIKKVAKNRNVFPLFQLS